MKPEQVHKMFGYLGGMVHVVTLRIVRAFPGEKLDWSPAPGARTPRQIIAHMYGSGSCLAHSPLTGKLSAEDEKASEGSAPKSADANALAEWCDAKMKEMKRDVAAITDEQLSSPVKAHYGEFPGWMMVSFIYDEHWHHRGQLTAYLRLLEIPVPFLYDYPKDDNCPS